MTNTDNCLAKEEIKCLVKDITVLLTGGRFELELGDEEWCSLIRLSINDFYYFIHRWIIDNKFGNFFGKDVSATDICVSLTKASFDYELLFAQAFSEDVGLQARGGRFELKKDKIDLIDGQQVYQIPANREVKKVLFATPSQIDYGLFASWGYGNIGVNQFGGLGAIGMYGYGASYGAVYPLFPAHDVILRTAHFNMTDRMLQSELTYKITKGPNGTRLLHLFSIPEYKRGLRKEMYSCSVWYEYYDTAPMSDEEKQACQKECSEIYAPHQIDLPKQDFCDLNHWGKTFVRKWLTALAKESVARARSKFKGKIANPGGADIELDWDTLLSEAKEEFKDLKEEISEFLINLRSDKQIERKAGEAENLNKLLSYIPNKLDYI